MDVNPEKTALVLIEYQNDFTSEGGALHGAVDEVMQETGMLENSRRVADEARRAGATVAHAPISFAPGYGERGNPDKVYGILKGVIDSNAFVKGTWGVEICDQMVPQEGDIVVEGKRGLDTFATTNLDFVLRSNEDRDGDPGRLFDQLLRRVDHAHRLREGLRRDHADRLHRRHQRRGAARRDRPRLPDVQPADDQRRGDRGAAGSVSGQRRHRLTARRLL
jgi:hypothetical protein